MTRWKCVHQSLAISSFKRDVTVINKANSSEAKHSMVLCESLGEKTKQNKMRLSNMEIGQKRS